MLKEAERKGAQSPAPVQERVPEVVPETPEELKPLARKSSAWSAGSDSRFA